MEEIFGMERKEFNSVQYYIDEESNRYCKVDGEEAKLHYEHFMRLHTMFQQTQMDIKARCLVLGCCLREILDNKLYHYIVRKDVYTVCGYSSFYKFCKEVYGLKERTAKRMVAVAREFCGLDGGVKIEYLNYSYSQLSELLSIEEKYRPRITVSCSVRDIRALGKYYKDNVPNEKKSVLDDLEDWKKICREERERANAKKNALTFIPSKKQDEGSNATVPTSAPSKKAPAQDDFDDEDEREIVTPATSQKTLSYEAVRSGLLRQLELLRTCDTGVAWTKAANIMEEALQKNAPSKVARFHDVVQANIQIADLKGKLQDLELSGAPAPTVKENQGDAADKKLNFKNPKERKEWVQNFKDWGVWIDNSAVGKRYYRYNFANGCSLIVEESHYYWENWQEKGKGKWNTGINLKYSIVDKECPIFNDSYSGGCSAIVEWMTKHSKEI